VSVIEKITALLTGLTPQQLRAMPPVARRAFADQCRRCADLAESRQDEPRSGVLYDLRTQQGQE
jgi:hypothetical protein